MLTWHTHSATWASLHKTGPSPSPSPSTGLTPPLHNRSSRAQHSTQSSQQGCVSTETIPPQLKSPAALPLTGNSYRTSLPSPSPLRPPKPSNTLLSHAVPLTPTSALHEDSHIPQYACPTNPTVHVAHQPSNIDHQVSAATACAAPLTRVATTQNEATNTSSALATHAPTSDTLETSSNSTVQYYAVDAATSNSNTLEAASNSTVHHNAVDAATSTGDSLEAASNNRVEYDAVGAAASSSLIVEAGQSQDGGHMSSRDSSCRVAVLAAASGCSTVEELSALVEASTSLSGHDALFILDYFCCLMGLASAVAACPQHDAPDASSRGAANEGSSGAKGSSGADSSSSLLRLAHLAKRNSGQPGELPASVERELLKAMRKTMSTFTSKDLIHMCSCLLALRCAPYPAFISTIAKCARRKDLEWTEQQFAALLYALGTWGHRTRAVRCLLDSLPQHLGSLSGLTPTEVPFLLKAVQKLSAGPPATGTALHQWWSKACWLLSQRLDHYDSHSLASLLNSVFSWTPLPSTAVTIFLRAVPVLCGMMDRHEVPVSRLSLILHSCAAANLYHTSLWQRASRYILSVKEWDQVSARDVADLMWIMGKSRYWDAALMGRLCSAAAGKLQDMTPRQLALMTWSLAKLRYRHSEAFLQKVQGTIMRSLKADSLRFLAPAAAHAGHDMDSPALSAHLRHTQWLVKDISQVVWSLPVLGTLTVDTFQTLLVHLELRLLSNAAKNVPTTSSPLSSSPTLLQQATPTTQLPRTPGPNHSAHPDDEPLSCQSRTSPAGVHHDVSDSHMHAIYGDNFFSLEHEAADFLDARDSIRNGGNGLSDGNVHFDANGHTNDLSVTHTPVVSSSSTAQDIPDLRDMTQLNPCNSSRPVSIHINEWDRMYAWDRHTITHSTTLLNGNTASYAADSNDSCLDTPNCSHSPVLSLQLSPLLDRHPLHSQALLSPDGVPGQTNGVHSPAHCVSRSNHVPSGPSLSRPSQAAQDSLPPSNHLPSGPSSSLTSQATQDSLQTLETQLHNFQSLQMAANSLQSSQQVQSSQQSSFTAHLHHSASASLATNGVLPPSGAFVHESPSSQSSIHESPCSQSLMHQSPSSQPFMHQSPSPQSCMHDSPSSQSFMHESPSSQSFMHESPSSQSFMHESPSSQSFMHESPSSQSCIHECPSSPSFVHDSPSSHSSVHDSPPKRAQLDITKQYHITQSSTSSLASTSSASHSSGSPSLQVGGTPAEVIRVESMLSPIDARQLFHAGMIMAINCLALSGTVNTPRSTGTVSHSTISRGSTGSTRNVSCSTGRTGNVSYSTSSTGSTSTCLTHLFPASTSRLMQLNGMTLSPKPSRSPSEGMGPSLTKPPFEGMGPSSLQPPLDGMGPSSWKPPLEGMGPSLSKPPLEGMGPSLSKPPLEGVGPSLPKPSSEEMGPSSSKTEMGVPSPNATSAGMGPPLSPAMHSLPLENNTTSPPLGTVPNSTADANNSSQVSERAAHDTDQAAGEGHAAQAPIFDPVLMLRGLYPDTIKASQSHWRTAVFSRSRPPPPAVLQEVCHVLQLAGLQYSRRTPSPSGLLCVELMIHMGGGLQVAVLADGPAQYSRNEPYRLLGDAVCNRRMLQAEGYHLLLVPFYMWRMLGNFEKKQKWLMQQLEQMRHGHTKEEQ